jgi:Na+/H+ antiporter NhaD/arsenite permease-like protein
VVFLGIVPGDSLLHRIDFRLFVLVGALVGTGVISGIASGMIGGVLITGSAMLIIVWFSTIASAIVDNISLTAALIPLIQDIGLAVILVTAGIGGGMPGMVFLM